MCNVIYYIVSRVLFLVAFRPYAAAATAITTLAIAAVAMFCGSARVGRTNKYEMAEKSATASNFW